jgi:RNA polymerase sigma-70 factor (ECF subfamily)
VSSAPVSSLEEVARERSTRSFADERSLACALIARREEAVDPACRLLRPFVDRTVLRLLGPDRDREDLIQEVFLRFFRRVSTLRDPDALRPFLFGITARVVKRELRRRWFAPWAPMRPAGVAAPEETSVSDPLARAAVARLFGVLAAVSAEDRSLFVARYVEEMDLAAVATAHGMSFSTARRRLDRAWKRVSTRALRDPILGGYLDERCATQPRRGLR